MKQVTQTKLSVLKGYFGLCNLELFEVQCGRYLSYLVASLMMQRGVPAQELSNERLWTGSAAKSHFSNLKKVGLKIIISHQSISSSELSLEYFHRFTLLSDMRLKLQ